MHREIHKGALRGPDPGGSQPWRGCRKGHSPVQTRELSYRSSARLLGPAGRGWMRSVASGLFGLGSKRTRSWPRPHCCGGGEAASPCEPETGKPAAPHAPVRAAGPKFSSCANKAAPSWEEEEIELLGPGAEPCPPAGPPANQRTPRLSAQQRQHSASRAGAKGQGGGRGQYPVLPASRTAQPQGTRRATATGTGSAAAHKRRRGNSLRSRGGPSPGRTLRPTDKLQSWPEPSCPSNWSQAGAAHTSSPEGSLPRTGQAAQRQQESAPPTHTPSGFSRTVQSPVPTSRAGSS